MKLRKTAITTALALALNVSPVFAANMVGYNKIEAPAGADARFSVPFNNKVEKANGVDVFTVDSKSANGVGVSETLVDNAYNGAYYIRFISGTSAGLWSTVSDNGANNVDMSNLNVLDKVSVNDTFRIYKHHTLGSLFPLGLEGISHVNQTRVLFYENNINSMSQNKAAVKTAVYNATSNLWQGSGINNNTILEPGTQHILRNGSGQFLRLLTLGDAPDYDPAVLVAANGDINIGSSLPLPVKLKDAGLGGVNQRRVLFFDNSAPGQNKAAVKTAVYSTASGTWVGFAGAQDELIKASESITFRLPAAEAFGTKVTLNNPLN